MLCVHVASVLIQGSGGLPPILFSLRVFLEPACRGCLRLVVLNFLSHLWRLISIGLKDVLIDATVYLGQKLCEGSLVVLLADPVKLLFRLLGQALEVILEPGNLGLLGRLLFRCDFITQPVIENGIDVYRLSFISGILVVLIHTRSI